LHARFCCARESQHIIIMDMDKIRSIMRSPKVLLILFLFLVVPVMVLLLSLLKPAVPIRGARDFLSPTPVPLKIPEGEEIPMPTIQTPPNLLINRLRDISFQIPDQSYPTRVKLYKTAPTPIDPQRAEEIADSLLFKNEPLKRVTQADTILSWTNEQGQLIFYLGTGNMEYFSSQSNTSLPLNSPQEAMVRAKDFLKTFSPYSKSLDPAPSDVSYYLSSPGDLKKVEDFNEGDTIDVPFVQKVNGLPIYAQFGSGARTHVWINKAGGIIKVSLKTQEALIAEGESQILSFDEAKRKIEEGEGTIVLYGEAYHGNSLPPPTTTTFSSARLAYLKDASNFLYPIFVFSGIATVEGAEEKIVVYLPAIK